MLSNIPDTVEKFEAVGIETLINCLPISIVTGLLWRHIERDCPEVDLLVRVDARHHEEKSRALGTARPQPAESEHHGSLVLLHNL